MLIIFDYDHKNEWSAFLPFCIKSLLAAVILDQNEIYVHIDSAMHDEYTPISH